MSWSSASEVSDVEEQPSKSTKAEKNKLTKKELEELELWVIWAFCPQEIHFLLSDHSIIFIHRLEKKILGKEKGLLKVLERETSDVSAAETPKVAPVKKNKKPAWVDEADSTVK